ncbi:unnamed protein product [Cuscuta campestris]|uniref:Uncharacterized protein n=1 Tax=Cuscuta campestris TaxID=132261 RepID=A0A484ME58_9ASTE|nr:unnamed protein product [Cuscuta campestris]
MRAFRLPACEFVYPSSKLNIRHASMRAFRLHVSSSKHATTFFPSGINQERLAPHCIRVHHWLRCPRQKN